MEEVFHLDQLDQLEVPLEYFQSDYVNLMSIIIAFNENKQDMIMTIFLVKLHCKM